MKFKYRTGAQVLSDIGGAPATGGAYLPLAGNTTATAMTGDIYLANQQQVRFLTSANAIGLRMQSSGTSSFIDNEVGDMYIRQEANDKDMKFQADDGSGGNATYFKLDGSLVNGTTTLGAVNFPDKSKLFFGSDSDLRIYHDGSDSYIQDSGTGQLYIAAENFRVKSDDLSKAMISANVDGAVSDLYYANALKLATTSSGISVTGGGSFSTSVTASGNSNSFGNTTITALTATSGTFSASVTAAGNSNSFGTTTFTGSVTTTSVITPLITTATNTSLFLQPNGSGHLYLGDSTNGTNLYHYSAANDGKYTTYDFNGNYYRISTTATSGVKIDDSLTVSADIILVGTGRIQGIDTVSAGTDAASKDYVDTAIGNIDTGVTGVSSATTSQLTVSQSSPAPELSIVTAAVTNGGTALATGDQIYDATTTRLGSYLPLAGSVYDGNTASWSNGITGNLALVSTSGTKGIIIGDEDNGAGQLFVQFNSSNGGGILTNNGGNLEITAQNYGDGSDIIFKGNDTNNNIVTYFQTVGASQKVRFLDNIKLTIGNGDDIQMYHDGTNSYIDNNFGHLYIRNNVTTDDGKNIYLQAKSGENGIIINDDSSVQLYNNNILKLQTSSTGVTVTGTAKASAIEIESTVPSVLFDETDVTANWRNRVQSGSYRIQYASDGTTFSDYFVLGASANTVLKETTFTGDIVLGASSSIVLDDTPTASTASGSGTIVNWSVSETVTAGTLYAVKTNGGWTLADADNENTAAYMLGIALGTNATQGMLLQGFFYKSGHGFTIGAPLYISTTGGTFSNSRPTASNDYVRVIGYATSANYIYFDPDKTWVKID